MLQLYLRMVRWLRMMLGSFGVWLQRVVWLHRYLRVVWRQGARLLRHGWHWWLLVLHRLLLAVVMILLLMLLLMLRVLLLVWVWLLMLLVLLV